MSFYLGKFELIGTRLVGAFSMQKRRDSMAKRMVIREIEPIEIVFRDKTLNCIFNNDALTLFAELYGGLAEAAEEGKTEPFSYAAKLLHCGVYATNQEFTLDEAKAIVLSGGMSFMAQLFNHLAESFLANATEEQKKTYLAELKKAMKATK